MLNQKTLAAIVVLMCSTAMAGNNPSSGASVRNQAKSGFAISPFDDKQDRLPPRYMGHSIALFQEIILGNDVIAKGKSEFETSSAYDERKKSTINNLKFAQLDINSRWAFMFTPNIKGGYLTYDAEHSQFVHNFYVSHNSGNSSVMPSFFFEEKREAVGSYIAQNAMGATGKVIKQNVLIRGLQVTQCQRENPNFTGKTFISSYLDEGGKYVHSFVMSSDVAQKQKSQLRYLFIVNSFNEPYVVEVNNHYAPKFPDDLIETTSRTITTFVKLDSIWLYNYETGEVLEKIAPCSIQQDKDKDEKQDKAREKINYLF